MRMWLAWLRRLLLDWPGMALLDLLWDADMRYAGAHAMLARIKARGLRAWGVHCAPHVYLARGFQLAMPRGAPVSIGRETFIGRGAYLDNHAPITIGEGCLLGPFLRVLTATHDPDTYTLRTAAVEIGPFCWLGAGVTILPGVRIGKGCIIGAGSLVTKDIPPFSVAYGVPCRVQRTRSLPIRQHTAIGRRVELS